MKTISLKASIATFTGFCLGVFPNWDHHLMYCKIYFHTDNCILQRKGRAIRITSLTLETCKNMSSKWSRSCPYLSEPWCSRYRSQQWTCRTGRHQGSWSVCVTSPSLCTPSGRRRGKSAAWGKKSSWVNPLVTMVVWMNYRSTGSCRLYQEIVRYLSIRGDGLCFLFLVVAQFREISSNLICR